MHDAAREEAMYSTRIVVDIIECLNHRNAAVRRKAEVMCDLGKLLQRPSLRLYDRLIMSPRCRCGCYVVLEFDRGADGQLGNLGKKILQKKFQSYNKEWLQAVEQEYAHHGYDYGVGASGAGARGLSGDNFFNDKVRECLM
jgi:hypothetical protein